MQPTLGFCVDIGRVADGHRGHRDALGHLHDGQQRVVARQGRRLHRDAHHREPWEILGSWELRSFGLCYGHEHHDVLWMCYGFRWISMDLWDD